MKFGVKSLVFATALLLPSIALAQTPAPAAATPAKPAASHVAKAPRPAAKKPAQTSPEVLEIVQILGIRQIDPATYEIDARMQNGAELHLRANAFVLQSLGQQLGTYGHQ